MSEFLVIDIKTFDDAGFHFYQTGLIRNVLEATGMENCNSFTTPTKVEAHLGIDENSSEANKYWNNSYASGIGMMLCLT